MITDICHCISHGDLGGELKAVDEALFASLQLAFPISRHTILILVSFAST